MFRFLKIINYGGDCDSTGAMYGNLMGARHGTVLPKVWESHIEARLELMSLATNLSKMKIN
jgi:ADP-ribosylglycohydrolase